VRLQLSMLLLPITTRANFWATKFNSFVVLEQLNIPNALGPCRSTVARRPAAARSSASSHPAGRKAPPSRTSGSRSRAYCPFLVFDLILAPILRRNLIESSKVHCTPSAIGLKPAHHPQRGPHWDHLFSDGDINMSRLHETASYAIETLNGTGADRRRVDVVAVEAPLEVRFSGRPATVLMRTPGHDEELVRGFLFTEGLI